MARRRSLDGGYEDGGFDESIQDDGGLDGLLASFGGDEGKILLGDGVLRKEATSDEQRDMIFGGEHPRKEPTLDEDISRMADTGNVTTGREMFDRGGLPQGMTVQQGSSYAMDTPMMAREPNPIASQMPNPSVQTPSPSMSPSPGASSTVRRSVSPGSTSALFGEEAGTPMFGRAGGLMGGGVGVPGTNEGAPTPTQMMQQLLQMFRQQR